MLSKLSAMSVLMFCMQDAIWLQHIYRAIYLLFDRMVISNPILDRVLLLYPTHITSNWQYRDSTFYERKTKQNQTHTHTHPQCVG